MHKRFLFVMWGISLAVLGVLALGFRGESAHFYGIADDREQTILFEAPVDIVRILVVEGDPVSQGQLIMEVQRDALSSELVILDEQLTELTTRDRETVAATRAKLSSLRSQQEAQQANLDSKIQSLQSRHDLNQSILVQLDGHAPDGDLRSNPILAEIEGLTRERQHLRASLEAEIMNLEAQLNANLRPIDAQVAELRERKSALQHQATKLTIRADFDGRVGSMMFRSGEIVPPFQPILTVHGSSPNYINGYIHEAVVNRVQVGQSVWVQSTTSGDEAPFIESTVESLGTRIVEYPERLKKNPMVQAWGREAVVRLSESHPLLLGEKVIVLLEKPGTVFSKVVATASMFSDVMNVFAETSVKRLPLSPSFPKESFIIPTDNRIDPKSIEASGVLWDPENLNFFMISDESSSGKTALYRMDVQGRITNSIVVKDAPQIDDLESLSADGPYLYLLSSLSHNKKGKLKAKRRQFLRLEQDGSHLISRGFIDLYHVLEQLEATTNDRHTAIFLKDALQSKRIDIEAHVVRNDNLILGFKSPRTDLGQTVFLRIMNLERIFAGRPPQGEIWETIMLVDSQAGEPVLLSDMLWIDSTLLLLGSRGKKQSHVSYVWAYDQATHVLREIFTISGLKAEGIARTQYDQEYLLVADGGGTTASRYLMVNLDHFISGGRI